MILNIENAVQKSLRLKENSKRIVTINGSFDLIHAGHIRSLKFAKEQGDVLFLGLNSDKSVKSYKSPHRPILPQNQRAEILSAIRYVDYIIILDEPDISVPLLRAICPNVHVDSIEYKNNTSMINVINELNIELVLLPKYEDISTTNIIKKIVDTYNKEGLGHCR